MKIFEVKEKDGIKTIEEIEVLDVNDRNVFFDGPEGKFHRARISDWRSYFDTYKEAKEYLIEKQQKVLDVVSIPYNKAVKRLEIYKNY